VTVEIALGLGIACALELAFGFWEAVPDPVFFCALGFCFTLCALASDAQVNNLGHRRTQCMAGVGRRNASAPLLAPKVHFGQIAR
jgi:hypothetical protein